MKGYLLSGKHFRDGKFIPSSTEISFSMSDVDLVVPVKIDGRSRAFGIDEVIATEAESLEDIDFMLSIEDEMRQHESLLIVDTDGVFAHAKKWYVYDDEVITELSRPIMNKRILGTKLALAIAGEMNIKVYRLIDTLEGHYVLCSLDSTGQVIDTKSYDRFGFDDALRDYYHEAGYRQTVLSF